MKAKAWMENKLESLRAEYEARKRDETRAPGQGLRGRVYSRKNPEDGPLGSVAAKSRPVAKIEYKIYRAAQGKWFDSAGNEIKLEQPVKVKPNIWQRFSKEFHEIYTKKY